MKIEAPTTERRSPCSDGQRRGLVPVQRGIED